LKRKPLHFAQTDENRPGRLASTELFRQNRPARKQASKEGISSMAETQRSPRMPWIEVAKACGIILVIYGHFVERLYDANYRAAYLQTKYLFAFTIPVFFVLSGYVFRDRGEDFRTYLKSHAASRLIPVLVFNLLGLAVFVTLYPPVDQADLREIIFDILSMVRGHPTYNWAMWFLVCLFTVEMIHFFLGKYATTSRRLIVFAIGAYLIGWFVLWQATLITEATGLARNFWFIHEVPVAYALYLVGILARRLDIIERPTPLGRLVLCGALLVVTFATFNLNTGPFVHEKQVVLMSGGSNGSLWAFPVTALTGAFLVCYLARLTRPARWLLFIAGSTIPLLGLDGLLHNYGNPLAAQWLSGFLPDTQLAVLVAATIATAATIAVCAPLMYLLSHYLPQLMGRPKVNGPLLRNLV
jgi:acyltransferase